MTITTDNAPPRPADGKSPVDLQRGGALSAGGPAMKVQCQQCGAEFDIRPSRIKHDRGKYCSRKCFTLSRTMTLEQFMAKVVKKPSGCWEWTGRTGRFGYGKCGCQSQPTHRFAYEHIVGPIPDGLCVLHRCDNPPCVNPDHLFLGTRTENMADKMRKGRHWSRRGSAHGRAILNEDQVLEIREQLNRGDKAKEIASRFGVLAHTIDNIKYGKTWAWLK